MPVGHCWSFRASPWKSVGTMFVRPSGDFGVRSPKGLLPLCGSKIHLRFPVAREFYGWLIIATSTSGDARRVVSAAPSACGWLRGTSRTSPGPPRRWRRPVRLQSTSARGRGFAAYLPGCARQLFIVRYAHYARGASLTTFGFVTIVPRYLPVASNSLTFVRGADRACCAPRKRHYGLICAPRKW